MARIIIPDDYQDAVRTLACFGRLATHEVTIYSDTVRDIDALSARFGDADALVLIRERTAITDALLERLPRLRVISQTGKGYAHIDLAACTRRGVVVCVGVGAPYAPAELTWALILASMRNIPEEVERMRVGQWQTTLGVGLRGRTVGVFGYGKIGTVVARIGQAFGMNVLIWGRDGSISRARADGFATAPSQRALFEQADVLTLHVKLDAQTRGIVSSEDLAAMQTTALLVNTSRAELITPGALVEALRAGRPGRAAVDVYEDEPTYAHPLLTLPNALCTPHLGYVERDSYELYFGTAFDNLLAYFAGRYASVVNPEALTRR